MRHDPDGHAWVDPDAQGRDDALSRLAAHRKGLIDAAVAIALSIARDEGSVTSPQVMEVMLRQGLLTQGDDIDRRFLGVVFRHKRWRRVGWSESGSHKRPVPIWELVDRGEFSHEKALPIQGVML